MNFKKTLAYFSIGASTAFILICLFNYLVDPFGIFGDKLFNWYGFNMTNNPRIAKIGYLDKHNNEYNSFIIGSSKTSSISPELLNKYVPGSKFYNMMMYGADMAHIEKTLKYLLDNYEVKNIVLHIGISELVSYDNTSEDTKEELHAKVSNKSLINFYAKYLTINPMYGLEKINKFFQEKFSRKPSKYNVFLPETGVYNKSQRDKENIINLNDYVRKIGDKTFLTYDKFQTDKADKCLESISRMKDYCSENGVSFKVISAPNYVSELHAYDLDVVKDYWIKLSKITDFWNFSGYNEVSKDPRYFYDSVHYRNLVGQMILGKIYNDKSVYYPKDFGVLMTDENARNLCDRILTPNPGFTDYALTVKKENEVFIPILMYHHIVGDNEKTELSMVSVSKFWKDMVTLKEAGYSTLFLKDLIEYVEGTKDLPEKPIVITFDDGYTSNYRYAFPILKHLNMKATINIVGSTVGLKTKKGTKEPIIPHFGFNEAREMLKSGVIDIQSHTYDLHEPSDSEIRYGCTLNAEETSVDYYNAFVIDNIMQTKMMKKELDIKPTVFTYPYGLANVLSEQVLKDLGYKVTLVIGNKTSKIQKGNPYSLYGLNRINVSEEISKEKLLQLISIQRSF